MPPVDPNAVLMTGENSFIRLTTDGGQSFSSRLSHWRVLWCPDGSGHVLFMQSELTGDGPVVYTDNEAVARWLQSTIERYLYPPFADTALPVIAATFTRHGDPRGEVTETIQAGGDAIVMSWSDCIDPFVLTVPPGTPPERPIGVFSTFFPARTASVERNGRRAQGAPGDDVRGDRPSSTACLAWSETWVAPRT